MLGRRGVIGWLLVLTLATGSLRGEDAIWKVGVASVKVTPEGPMWMAGYASRTKPSEGVAQDLFAKALAIEDAQGHKLVFVTLDLISVPGPLRKAIDEQIQKRHGLTPSSLLMNCSHTHCGPEIRVTNATLEDLDAERRALSMKYVESLQGNILNAISTALSKLEPAKLSYQHARAGFAMNRRTPTPKGYSNFPNPEGPVDHDVPVLRVDSTDGKLRAVLFGYACHNTTLGFFQFCGDYAGYAQEYFEADHPGVTALFLMGCGGDQNPYPRGTIELARMHGRSLATSIDAALQTTPRPLTGTLSSKLDTADLTYDTPPTRAELETRSKSTDKYDQTYAQRLLKQLDQQGRLLEKYPAPVQVVRLGNEVTLVALPGETVVDYSLRLKRELTRKDGPAVWVAGYSNDVFAYVPSRRVLEEGGYEAVGAMRYMTTVLQPGAFTADVEERLIAKVHELLKAP
jgi:hypothetical protein